MLIYTLTCDACGREVALRDDQDSVACLCGEEYDREQFQDEEDYL